ncbi:MAG: diadenylate cyclase CdaA [Bacilli bacterium]|jgi:diadenylate cyclase
MQWIDDFIKAINEYAYNFSIEGIVRIALDALVIIGVLVAIYKLLKIKIHSKKMIALILFILIGYGIVSVMQLAVASKFLRFILFWSFGILILAFSQEIKYAISTAFHSTSSDNSFTTEEEKKHVIDVLVNTARYLSKRRIGALMTIERDDNLNSFIEKSIFIKGYISEELLTTIFTVGTATHDGAVIIRKNRVMCAGAYLPSTDRYDVPKSLGTRHRAAIGISERYDAITIVVSEETGNISITADGAIEQALSDEKLIDLLESYLIVK